MSLATETAKTGWQTRYTVVGLCFAATFVCYIDRVNISVAILPMAKQLGWDVKTQGLVLSSFYIGYLLMQIAGGRLADRFGGKLILGLGVLVWSLFTIFTPPAAFLGLGFLLIARVGMGLGEAVTFPSVYSLVTRWIPISERSRAIALNASGIPIGTVFALIVTPIVVESLGWQWAFYLFGAVGVTWYAAWQWLVTTDPNEHRRISATEIEHLRLSVPAPGLARTAPSLGHFLRNRALWAIIVAHFCGNWTLYVVLSWLPKYVNEGLGVPFAAVGVISMLPHLTSFLFLNVLGNFTDRLIRSGMNVTKVRKLMQTVGFGGLAVCLFLIPQVDSVAAAIGILCLGKVFSAANIGGYAVNHMDIGPRHAGTLMGITNTAGTIPGIVGVYVSALILDVTGSWALVFQVTAAVSVFGLVFYLLFASGEQQFD